MSTHDIERYVVFAGFWRRFCACAIDYVVLAIVMVTIFAIDISMFHGELGSFEYKETSNREIIEETVEANEDGGTDHYMKFIETRLDYNGRKARFEIEKTVSTGNYTTTTTFWKMIDEEPDWGGKYKTFTDIFVLLGCTAYFVLFWSSKHQATWGGRIMKYKIIDYRGEKIGIGRALGRYLLAWLQIIIFPLGLMIAFTRRKQGIHDLIAKTLVVTNISIPESNAEIFD